MKLLGISLMALPFVGTFIVIVCTSGWQPAITIFGGVAVVALCIIFGSYLLNHP